jgi:hypothetical protein
MIPVNGGSHGQDPSGPPASGGGARLECGGAMLAPTLRTVAGRYRVAATVITGPGWSCHLADDLESGQPVRLRLVDRELADQEGFGDRVHRHALLVRELSGSCPGIAEILDAGSTADGSFFLALEPIEGETLGTLVKGGVPVSLCGALRLAIRIGEVVEAAHNAGLIDGRLDPGRTLMVGSGVAVKLVDFGLDRALGAEPSAEQVAWLAPEITSGGPCSERTDVYGIGAMLYLLLTGRPPARVDARSGASRPGGRRDLVPPGKLREGIPREVTAILLRALDHDPARRHEDVSVLLNDLSESLGLIAPVSRRHRPGAGLLRLAGRWRVAASVVGAAAAMAALWLAYPNAGALITRSVRDNVPQSGRGDIDAARAVQPRGTPSATPPAAPELQKPDTSTAATPAVSAPPSTAVPPPSPGPAVEPRATLEDKDGPPPSIPAPDPAESAGLPLPTTPPRPVTTRQMVEGPARLPTRAKPVRAAEREAPPLRSVPTPRADMRPPEREAPPLTFLPTRRPDSGDPGRAPISAIAPTPVTESPRPAPPLRQAPARDAGEDPGAIIDWLLRDRR